MRITIAVSAYASTKYLGACLENLLTQTIIDQCEVIVVDSGSPENEQAVCERYRHRFKALQYVRTERETLYAAWNRALAQAKGKYFVNANTDDALHPQALRIFSSALDKHRNAALAYADYVWSDAPNARYPWDTSFRRIAHERYHPKLALFYAYAGCHQFWRTSKLREIGGFPPNRKSAGDYEALCALLPRRFHAVYVPQALSAFYQNPLGLSQASGVSHEEFLQIRNKLRSEVRITDLFAVHPRSGEEMARAWLILARDAITLKIPWYTQSAPDIDFAKLCVDNALSADPGTPEGNELWHALRYKTASELCSVLAQRPQPTALESLLRRLVGDIVMDHFQLPRSRVPSPIFTKCPTE